MHASIVALASASALISTVSAHGFLMGIGKLDANTRGSVRDYAKINIAIDDLRSPLVDGEAFCRGAAKSANPVALTLTEGGSLTITQAFSLGAQHIGPCAVEIVDADNTANIVTLTEADGLRGCAVTPIAQFETDKNSAATAQCNGLIPSGLITNDMCMQYWTFTTNNVDQITCTNCILRWTWEGEHISVTNPEKYENCIDVKLTKNGSGSGKAATVAAPVPTTTAKATKATATAAAPSAPVATKTPVAPSTGSGSRTGSGSGSSGSSKSNGCMGNSVSAPYMACNGEGFLVCFPGQTTRAATPMSCAPGTKCSTSGKYISCIAK
ncbi:hypothetical protein HKX48_005541 [Thoreauomyces humboldtii]|nr:hypothetical protein HKX48_005541 [Thoreauomyces humboldtii]